jgi:hypothetical protein
MTLLRYNYLIITDLNSNYELIGNDIIKISVINQVVV